MIWNPFWGAWECLMHLTQRRQISRESQLAKSWCSLKWFTRPLWKSTKKAPKRQLPQQGWWCCAVRWSFQISQLIIPSSSLSGTTKLPAFCSVADFALPKKEMSWQESHHYTITFCYFRIGLLFLHCLFQLCLNPLLWPLSQAWIE